MKQKYTKTFSVPIVFLVFYILYLFDIPIPCIFHRITGWYCPGCGITRCLVSFLSFDFYQAFRYNPLVFILLPFFIPYLIYRYVILFLDKEDKITKKLPNAFWYVLLVIAIIFGIIRNTNLFSFLAPTVIN